MGQQPLRAAAIHVSFCLFVWCLFRPVAILRHGALVCVQKMFVCVCGGGGEEEEEDETEGERSREGMGPKGH